MNFESQSLYHQEEIMKAKDAEKKALELRNKLEMEQFELV
jgi:hypothetical protein